MSAAIRLDSWDRTRDGELSEDAMRGKLERLGYHAHARTYSPGTRFRVHRHEQDRIVGVLSGRFRLTEHGRHIVVEAGDLAWVPGGTLHSAEVLGIDPVLSLDAWKRAPLPSPKDRARLP